MARCEAKERKILVAVDEGDESMYALSWCLNNILVSQNSKDTLILLYAKATPPSIHNAQVKHIVSVKCCILCYAMELLTCTSGVGYLFSDDIVATMEKYNNEAAESVMEKANKLCKEVHTLDFKVEMRVESGDARDVICQVAEKLDVNLVVMGSHGYGLIKRWVYHHFSTFD
ncbi:hypothetical protein TEA_027370 [Camellia sinensis var. sinensis]|uniref:UspA domain-containing protein n=1 Tax=Camellia sinensis var. sinensis TaxID=542762 RepID=A0A4S4DAY4_CAMSN|nr:hypothetical protein TEA_027370 [Camellia sinensis var. sinensis]